MLIGLVNLIPLIWLNLIASLAIHVPSITKASSLEIDSHTTLGALNTSNFNAPPNLGNNSLCFDPPYGREYRLPADQSDCFQIANQLIYLGRWFVPLTFSRHPGADIRLPKDIRYGRCFLYLNMFDHDDIDVLEMNFVFTTALEIARSCTTGEHIHGGRTFVGPRRLLHIIMAGCVPPPIASLPATSQGSQSMAEAQIRGTVSKSARGSRLAPRAVDKGDPIAVENGCFDIHPQSSSLNSTMVEDCSKAADALVYGREPYRAITFARGRQFGFHLPQTFQEGSCTISLDVSNEKEHDSFMPIIIYLAAVDLAWKCRQGPTSVGGMTRVGPKHVVNLVVSFDRISPSREQTLQPLRTLGPLSNERNDSDSKGSHLSMKLVPQFTPLSVRSSLARNISSITGTPDTSISSNGSITLNSPAPEGNPMCSNVPYPGTRAWPILYHDCEQAILLFVGNRALRNDYIFTRGPDQGPYYYSLPVTFKYASCSIHVNLIDDDTQERVRLALVVIKARYLARTCSGLGRQSWQRYGGWVTVGSGAGLWPST